MILGSQYLFSAELNKEKNNFLVYEIGLLSLKAALSTRAKDWPIYSPSCKEYQREKVKHGFRQVLDDIFPSTRLKSCTKANMFNISIMSQITFQPSTEVRYIKAASDLASPRS
ncbi:hypothetical protein D3C87_815970 [compost metagenome]